MLQTRITVSASLQARIDRLRASGANLAPLLVAAVNTSALNVQANARKIVPVVTGELQKSIEVTFDDDGMTAHIGSNLAYAGVQEFSERPHPVIPRGNVNPEATWGFLRKSLTVEKPYFVQKLRDAVGAMQ